MLVNAYQTVWRDMRENITLHSGCGFPKYYNNLIHVKLYLLL
jgi:hypothetical protein